MLVPSQIIRIILNLEKAGDDNHKRMLALLKRNGIDDVTHLFYCWFYPEVNQYDKQSNARKHRTNFLCLFSPLNNIVHLSNFYPIIDKGKNKLPGYISERSITPQEKKDFLKRLYDLSLLDIKDCEQEKNVPRWGSNGNLVQHYIVAYTPEVFISTDFSYDREKKSEVNCTEGLKFVHILVNFVQQVFTKDIIDEIAVQFTKTTLEYYKK